jgi:aldehyde:ferredoxin oxidoreductase
MQPWFLRCQELGVHAIRGHDLHPRKAPWFGRFLTDVAHRRGLGAIFADGMRRAADDLDGELPAELTAAGRSLEFAFGFPAHREGRIWDHEPSPYWLIAALMYASESRDPTIGTHSASLMLTNVASWDPETAPAKLRRLALELWDDERALEPGVEHAPAVAIWSQHQHIVNDSLPLCDFAFPRTVGRFASHQDWYDSPDTRSDIEIGARLFSAVTGMDATMADLERVAERTLNLERAILALAGRDRALDLSLAPHFSLPCRSDGTRLDTDQFAAVLDAFYGQRGWDRATGWPTRAKLEFLGLADVARRLGA